MDQISKNWSEIGWSTLLTSLNQDVLKQEEPRMCCCSDTAVCSIYVFFTFLALLAESATNAWPSCSLQCVAPRSILWTTNFVAMKSFPFFFFCWKNCTSGPFCLLFWFQTKFSPLLSETDKAGTVQGEGGVSFVWTQPAARQPLLQSWQCSEVQLFTQR